MGKVGFSGRIAAQRLTGGRRVRGGLRGAALLALAGAAGLALPALVSSGQAARSTAPIPPPEPVVAMPAAARPANASAPLVNGPSPALAAVIETLGRQFDGEVGIAVERVDTGWTIAWNGSRLFPQQSVSKLWVAMTMLDAIDRGKLTLATPVTIRQSDLTLFHQPIAALVRGDGYHTTLAELFERAMTESDNTANDSVLRTVGGSDAVRSFLARRFTSNIRFGPGERLLQSQTAGLDWTQDMAMGRQFYVARARLPRAVREKALDDYLANPPDGAAPLAIVHALAKLKRGEMLSPRSTALLLDTMGDAKTGPKRVKGGVPDGWHYVHKTGTGQELGARATGYNDVGVMTAPDGTSYAIAVMIGSTTQPIPKRWELMQSVSRAVAALHSPGGGAVAAASR